MTNKEAIEEIRSMGLIIDAMTHGTRRKSIYEALNLAIKALEDRPQGKWINQSQGAKYPCECSECHTEPFCNDYGYVLTNYCPNCGADMRGERR